MDSFASTLTAAILSKTGNEPVADAHGVIYFMN
jgi:hypothetical protein